MPDITEPVQDQGAVSGTGVEYKPLEKGHDPEMTTGDGVVLSGSNRGGETAEQPAASSSGDMDEMTKDELYEQATDLDIEGRSTMSKAELAKAVKKAQSKR